MLAYGCQNGQVIQIIIDTGIDNVCIWVSEWASIGNDLYYLSIDVNICWWCSCCIHITVCVFVFDIIVVVSAGIAVAVQVAVEARV